MWQMIVALNLLFPGPVLNVEGEDGLTHPVAMQTQTFRLAIQGFPSQADCESYTGYQKVPMVFTNALGVMTPETVTASFVKCERQPAT
jgi:hypothetical protein